MTGETPRPFFHRLQTVEEALKHMPSDRRVAFAAACCERLLPSYVALSERTGWGNPGALRSGLDRIWDHLTGDADALEVRSSLLAECEAACPGPDAPDHVATDPECGIATNACVAVSTLLDATEDDDPEPIRSIAELALNSVDAYLFSAMPELDPNDGGRSDRIVDEHHLMRREVERQLEDLRSLGVGPLAEAAVALRARSRGVDAFE